MQRHLLSSVIASIILRSSKLCGISSFFWEGSSEAVDYRCVLWDYRINLWLCWSSSPNRVVNDTMILQICKVLHWSNTDPGLNLIFWKLHWTKTMLGRRWGTHLTRSPSISAEQFTSRLTRPSPDVCHTQLWPCLVVSSPELSTDRFLVLLAGGGDVWGWRGFSRLSWPGCRLASARRMRHSRKTQVHRAARMVAVERAAEEYSKCLTDGSKENDINADL